MADTYCPTCMEPWDMDEQAVVRKMRITHRCPCCPKDAITDGKLADKLEQMLFGDDLDDEDPFSCWI